jgi:Cu+-exporting ATPase
MASRISCKVEGMSCSNCALSISKYLQNEGMQNVMVSFATGDVSFDWNNRKPVDKLLQGINNLGYRVAMPDQIKKNERFLSSLTAKFFFCLVFTIPLLLHMFIGWHWLHHPYVQLALALPVYITGMWQFGRSAVRSLRSGVPNMDVLISIGATAAFVYSLAGTVMSLGSNYLFYETAASIITLIFLGNMIEERSVRQTTSAISDLAKMQITSAKLIIPGTEQIKETDSRELKAGDKVLVNTGDKIPVDGIIYRGSGYVNEAMITGESRPVFRNENDKVIGGTLLENGSIKMDVTATGRDTVLSYIIELVKQAQGNKSNMQRLADRISAVFVPVVIGIALLTFGLAYFVFHIPFRYSMMRSIAVLVIACPCAMGLATPLAVMVGLGRAARNGILIKGAHTLESFKNIRQVVFDKTGTLTTGKMAISAIKILQGNREELQQIVYSLEKYSSHPIAKTFLREWKNTPEIALDKINEIKGIGIEATDKQGHHYQAGSYKIAEALTGDHTHHVYVVKDHQLLGWIDLEDTIRQDAGEVIAFLKKRNIKTILLSGDRQEKCDALAKQLGIDEVYAEQSPEQKMQKVDMLVHQAPTAMVGDGINDAPALARTDIGISLSDATQVAMQSANVILLSDRLKNLPLALELGKHTYQTIKGNLFWAFFYNVIAIPVAAFGFLSPIIGAAVMGLSDVVLAVNSIRLKYKKVV